MKARRTPPEAAVEVGTKLEVARLAAGLSSADLARTAGISRRRTAAIERGSATPTDSEVEALADACSVDVVELLPPGHKLSLVTTRPDDGPLQGEPALDALLREYVSMVLELRNASELPLATLRHEDLTELAHALGGTPDAIEARLIELLGTDAEGARTLHSVILPSVDAR